MGVPHIPNPSERPPRRWSRRGVFAALGAVPAAVLTGCTGAAADVSGGTGTASSAKQPAITVTPADGTTKAGFTSPVEVTVTDGTLASVKVTGDDGSSLEGGFNDTRTKWTSAKNPYSGTEYTVTATATAEGGAAASDTTASFTTRSPGDTFVGYFTPEAGSTSGVGMPVSIDFTHAVTDKAAVQKAITVTAEPAVEIVGRWFGDTRLDFRPETYWAAGTTVTLSLRLKDIEGAEGVYGVQSKDVTFRIGREQISTVDLATKRMTVVRDREIIADYPVSGGDSAHTTWSGIMVISERFEQTRMKSSTVGLGDEYDISDVPHAQRLTTSGTFVHGNYWASTSVDGYRFYESSMLGDVVVVRNSGEETVDPANGLNGWNVAWAQWQAGSAL